MLNSWQSLWLRHGNDELLPLQGIKRKQTSRRRVRSCRGEVSGLGGSSESHLLASSKEIKFVE